MNTYKVKFPDGKIRTLQGDNPPTPDDLEAIYAQINTGGEMPSPEAPMVKPVIDPMTTPEETPVQSGVGVGEYLDLVAEGGQSLLKGALGGTLGFAGDVESLGRMLVAPNTETELYTTAEVRKATDPIIDFFRDQDALETEGQEALGTIGEFVAPAAYFKTAGKLIDRFKQSKVSTEKQKALLSDDELKYNTEVAPFKLNSNGKVVQDVDAINLMKKSVPEHLSALVSKADPSTKKVMASVAETLDQMHRNKKSASVRSGTTPIGKGIIKRLKVLKGVRQRLGQSLDDVVKKELSAVEIPLEVPKESLISSIVTMFDLKPHFNAKGKLALPNLDKLDKETKKSLLNAYELLSRQTDSDVISGRDAHRLKKILDDVIDTKGGTTGQKQSVERVILDLRSNLNETLRKSSSGYASINDSLSKVLAAEEPYKKFSPRRNWDDPNLVSKMGVALKNSGVDSKIGQENLQNLIRLEDTLKERGVRFKDDVITAFNFHNEMDAFLRAIDKTSLTVGGKDYASRALSLLSSSAVHNTFGAVHDVKHLIGLGMKDKAARQLMKDREEAIVDIKRMLKENKQ